MNRNQLKGSIKETAGKVQRKVGKITGSARQQIKGTAKQVEGKLQKSIGDVEQAQEDAAMEREEAEREEMYRHR